MPSPLLGCRGSRRANGKGSRALGCVFLRRFTITDRSSGDKKFARGFLPTIGKWCSAMGFL